jgi:hypothetical protein
MDVSLRSEGGKTGILKQKKTKNKDLLKGGL